MTSLFELLAGGLPSEAEYRADNPLFNAARGMASIQVQPRTSAEAWWMPATQGLLSGFLQGAGKAQAREAQYSDIKALPGIQQLLAPSPDFIGPPDPMHAYTSETAPEGWTPKIGKADMIMAALSAQTQQEEAIRKAEHAAKFEEMLANKYGAMISPDGKNLMAIPQLREIQAENAGAIKGAEVAAERSGSPLGAVPKDLEAKYLEEKKTSEEARNSKKVISELYDGIKNLSKIKSQLSVGGVALTEDAATLGGSQATLMGVIQKFAKGNPSDKENAVIKQAFPSGLESDAVIEIKKQKMLKFIELSAEGTPVTQALVGAGLIKPEEAIRDKISKPSPADYSSFAEYKAAKDAWRASTGG